jgi:glycolate oxidase FAD binding subunit
VFACNLAGPRRIKAGAARDHFLGVQAVTGRGDLIKSGGRVVKNVTGYDLCKLFAGSFGTLAAMTEVTFKVLPAAEHECTLLLRSRTREAGFAALRKAMSSAGDVSGAAFLPAAAAARSAIPEVAGAAGDLAVLRLEGPAPSVRARVAGLQALLASDGEIEELAPAPSATLWREIRDVALVPVAPPLWRISVPPTAGLPLVEELERQFAVAWLADWAGGLLWLAVDGTTDGGAAQVRAALAAPGGHATLVRASAELRRAVPVFQPQEPALARLSARVKDSFDPERILNRGRMYPDV